MKRSRSMGFGGHLDELRRRLIRVLLVLAAASAACLAVAPRILALLIRPYGGLLTVIGPTEGVAVYLLIAIACASAITLPYLLWEAWGFVAPGLLRRERRLAAALIPGGVLLFLVGAAFAWFVLVPTAVRLLAGLGVGVLRTEWTSRNYVPFVLGLVFWIGVSFELPLVVLALARLGIVSAAQLLKYWRHAVLAIVAAAALITPTTDPLNLALVAVPLIALFFASVLFASFVRPRHRRSSPQRQG